MNDYSRSLIRTIVPLLVGAVVGWLASHGVKIDEATVLPMIDSIAAAGYYAIVRALEHRWPSLGWLLGAPGAPTYGATTAAPQAPVYSSATSVEIPAMLRPTDQS
jgi:hypothetical protein